MTTYKTVGGTVVTSDGETADTDGLLLWCVVPLGGGETRRLPLDIRDLAPVDAKPALTPAKKTPRSRA